MLESYLIRFRLVSYGSNAGPDCTNISTLFPYLELFSAIVYIWDTLRKPLGSWYHRATSHYRIRQPLRGCIVGSKRLLLKLEVRIISAYKAFTRFEVAYRKLWLLIMRRWPHLVEAGPLKPTKKMRRGRSSVTEDRDHC